MLGQILGLRHALAQYRGLFLGSLVLVVSLLVCSALVSAFSAWTAALVARDVTDLGVLLAVLVALVAGYGLLVWQESWWSHVLAYRVLSKLRIVLHAAIGRIAPTGLHGRRTGKTAGTVLNDVEQLEWFYAHTAAASLAALAMPVVMITGLVTLIGPWGLLLLVPIGALVVPLWLLAPVQARQGEAVRAELSELKATALEGAQGLRDLISVEATDRWIDQVDHTTGTLQHRRRLFTVRSGAESAWADALLAASTVATLAGLALLVQRGALSADLIPVALVLVFHAYAPVVAVMPMWQRLGELAAAADRVREVTQAPSPVDSSRVSTSTFTGEGPIELDQVTHRHPGADTTALEAASATLTPGVTTAVVGASGAGKSTLAHLLVRFQDPTSGTIRIGGRDLATIAEDAVRDQVTLVPQQNQALRATVAQNLRLASPEATEDQLWQVLTAVGLTEEVKALTHGLDTRIGEGGGTLSGGQVQRLAIARALLLDPAVLLLDEPVAHLDAFAESVLNTTLRRARAGRTTIVIAHRVSTIRAADEVLWLADGRVRGHGTHTDLLSEPAYRALLGQPAPIRERG